MRKNFTFYLLVCCVCSNVLQELLTRQVCSSTQWCKKECGDCGHCFRIAVGGLTIDGDVKKRKQNGRISYRKQRHRLIRLYRGTHALEAMLHQETRVLRALGRRL